MMYQSSNDHFHFYSPLRPRREKIGRSGRAAFRVLLTSRRGNACVRACVRNFAFQTQSLKAERHMHTRPIMRAARRTRVKRRIKRSERKTSSRASKSRSHGKVNNIRPTTHSLQPLFFSVLVHARPLCSRSSGYNSYYRVLIATGELSRERDARRGRRRSIFAKKKKKKIARNR